MVIKKVRLKLDELREHVLDWALTVLDGQRDIYHRIVRDDSIPHEEKNMIYGGIANHIIDVLDLLKPFDVEDADNLLVWAQEFVDDYYIEDPFDYRNLN